MKGRRPRAGEREGPSFHDFANRTLGAVLAAALLVGAAFAEEQAAAIGLKSWREVRIAIPPTLPREQAERIVLSNGLVAWFVQDSDLPWVELGVTLDTGVLHEPAEKAGLAALTAEVVSLGGSTVRPGEALEPALAARGARGWLGTDADGVAGGFSCPKERFTEALTVFAETLRRPAFPEDQWAAALTAARVRVARRNDSPAAIVQREFLQALYRIKEGQVHPYGRQPEFDTLQAISREDLADFHRAHFRPDRCVVSLAGDLSRAEAVAGLERAFGDWARPREAPPAPPELKSAPDRRVF